MPQETNLNVAPYFDDFDPISNYYKVLFKPGYPIQARELNNVQSIFQDQIENVGNHFFNEGAKVIPGNTSYYQNFQAIQINSSYAGIPVSLYLDQLVGKKITGVVGNKISTDIDSSSASADYTWSSGNQAIVQRAIKITAGGQAITVEEVQVVGG